jgi:hypothetical protein
MSGRGQRPGRGGAGQVGTLGKGQHANGSTLKKKVSSNTSRYVKDAEKQCRFSRTTSPSPKKKKSLHRTQLFSNMNERNWGSEDSNTDGRLNEPMSMDEIEAMRDAFDSDDYIDDLVELLSQSRKEKDILECHLRNYQGDNKRLQQQFQKLRDDNQDLNNKVQKLEEEQQRCLQESVATEALVSETYNKVGKFAKEDLFHHKKFVNDDNDLNDITDEGSLGKRTMDYFNISESHWVAWWNTYKKAVADAIVNQRSAMSSNIKRELTGMCDQVKGETPKM